MKNSEEKVSFNFEVLKNDKNALTSTKSEFRNQIEINKKMSDLLVFTFLLTIVLNVFVSIKLTEEMKTYGNSVVWSRILIIIISTFLLSFATISIIGVLHNTMDQMGQVMNKIIKIEDDKNTIN